MSLSKQEAAEFRAHLERMMDASEESYLFIHRETGTCALNVYDASDARALATLAIAALTSVGISGGNPLVDVLRAVSEGTDSGYGLTKAIRIREGNEHRAWPVVMEAAK